MGVNLLPLGSPRLATSTKGAVSGGFGVRSGGARLVAAGGRDHRLSGAPRSAGAERSGAQSQGPHRDRRLGARLLAARHADGVWGQRFYQPKWTSSHYTLLDLRTLEVDPAHPLIRASIAKILAEEKKRDGGIGPGRSIPVSDVCVNRMFLNYAAFFGSPEDGLKSVVDSSSPSR